LSDKLWSVTERISFWHPEMHSSRFFDRPFCMIFGKTHATLPKNPQPEMTCTFLSFRLTLKFIFANLILHWKLSKRFLTRSTSAHIPKTNSHEKCYFLSQLWANRICQTLNGQTLAKVSEYRLASNHQRVDHFMATSFNCFNQTKKYNDHCYLTLTWYLHRKKLQN
jgi:hypothetical protein